MSNDALKFDVPPGMYLTSLPYTNAFKVATIYFHKEKETKRLVKLGIHS